MIDVLEAVERVVDGQQVHGWLGGFDLQVVERLMIQASSAPQALFLSRLINQDSPHGLGGGAEEMAARVPRWRRFSADQPQIRLVDQCRGLERLAGFFVSEPGGGELAELVVDKRQKLVGGGGVAG